MPGEPQPTTGSTYGRDRLQVRTIALVFIVDGPREDQAAEPYDQLDNFAPAAPMGLVEVGRAASKQDDGDWKLTITFEGVVGDGALGALLEYDNSSVDTPIEEFEKIDALAAVYGKNGKPPVDADGQFKGWPREINASDGTGNQIPNPLWGTSHFLEVNTILRITFVTKDFHPEYLKNLCKIDTPQVPAGQEANIETPEGKSWLKKAFKAKFRGNCWENELEYWLGKWAPPIYNPTN